MVMKTSKYSILISFILLIGLLFGVWLILDSIAIWVNSQSTTIIATIITAAFGLSGVLFVQWKSKGRDITESHRESKIAM